MRETLVKLTFELLRKDMQCRKTRGSRVRPGMTILETTLVLLVLLSLVSVLFVSTRRWKKGSERTLCVLSQRQVQQAVRGFSNMHGKREGEEVPGLAFLLFGEGKYIEKVPLCPSGGIYSFMGEEVPMRGDLYMKCSLAEDEAHLPDEFSGW